MVGYLDSDDNNLRLLRDVTVSCIAGVRGGADDGAPKVPLSGSRLCAEAPTHSRFTRRTTLPSP